MLRVVYAKYHYPDCHNKARYSECICAECHYAECRYAECRYAECRGAASSGQMLENLFFFGIDFQ
jgi:hypothetical protein